jgi:amino acid adenylation domain-containing protein
MEEQLKYWRKQLAGLPPVLELPTDYPRPAVACPKGGVAHWTIEAEVTAGLSELSRRTRCTLYMVLLGAFHVLLARYTGRDDVVVGTPAAGRVRREVEGIVGFFVNTLAVRVKVSGQQSFKELMEQVRQVVLNGQANQDVPFDRVVEELGAERSLSHSPVFQVFFNMLNIPDGEISFHGLHTETIPFTEIAPKFDLTLYAKETRRGIDLTLVYNANLFNARRMTEMLEQFDGLLRQVMERPEEKTARLSLVTANAERFLPNPVHPLRSQWKGAAHKVFSEQTLRAPDQVATIDKDGAWTYKELSERSKQLANQLLASGIQPQEVVAIYAHRSKALVCALLGVLKAGSAFLILDPSYPDLRLIEYLNLARPRGLVEIEGAGQISSELENAIESLSFRCHLKVRSTGATEPASLRSGGRDTVDSRSFAGPSIDDDPSIDVEPNDLAYVAFTSGSTGKPKGVLGTHDSLTHFPSWIERTFGIHRSDRFSMLSGLSHDPLLRDIFTPLQLGSTLCIPVSEKISEPGWLAQWMDSVAISVTNLTPAMAQLLVSTTSKHQARHFTSLRYAFFAGDALHARDVLALKALAPRVTCINLYGTTETQRALAYLVISETDAGVEEKTPKQPPEKETVPIGRGIEDVQLLILNQAHRLAGIGEMGEIYFRSPHLAKGYLGAKQLTSESFIRNPLTNNIQDRLYKTGDLGRYLPDGNVELVGRADHQVKIRGFRVETAEIEAVLKQQPAILNCTVTARVDESGEKALVAYVVNTQRSCADFKLLREQVLRRLPHYMVPAYFVGLAELPLTPNGKLDRDALPPPNRIGDERNSYVPPRTATEEVLAGIWTKVLRKERVGVNENFFELGGHSLLATRIIARVREVLQVSIPLSLFFESPTIADLGRYLDAEIRVGQGLAVPPIQRVQRGAPLPLSFDQEAWLLREWLENPGSRHIRADHSVLAYRLSGSLNIAALEKAVNEIVRRHEILRTSFPMNAGSNRERPPRYFGRPVQAIAATVTIPIPVTDLTHISAGQLEEGISVIVAEESDKPFLNSSVSMLRAFLLKLNHHEHVLAIVLHHMICDGWSVGVLLKELSELYDLYCARQPSLLAALPIQFADFAYSQREFLKGQVLQTLVSYWKEQLAAVQLVPEMNFPFARPDPASPHYQRMGQTQRVTLSAASYLALQELSRQQHVTLFILLLAALNTLLHRYTGREHVGVFAPMANRSRPETHDLIGWFATSHILTSDFSIPLTFSDLLAQVRDRVLGAYTHQDIPASLLMRLLFPYFQNSESLRKGLDAPFVFFDLRVGKQTLNMRGLEVKPVEIPSSSADAGLTIVVSELMDELTITIGYSADRFEAAGVSQMLADFQNLLAAIVTSPQQQVTALARAVVGARGELHLTESLPNLLEL